MVRVHYILLQSRIPPLIGSLSTHVFETQTATGRQHLTCQGSGVSQIFILIISNGEKIRSNVNVVVWRQVKTENSSFPVAVRISKTRVLKLAIIHCIRPPRSLRTKTYFRRSGETTAGNTSAFAGQPSCRSDHFHPDPVWLKALCFSLKLYFNGSTIYIASTLPIMYSH